MHLKPRKKSIICKACSGAICSKCCLRYLTTLPRNISCGIQRYKHTYSLTLPPFPPTCTTLTALLSFPLTHTTWCSVSFSSSLNSAPSSSCSASLPPSCLYLYLASPNSLQAYTHWKLFLPLSHSDLAREHSCPASIPPHGLFCFRPFPLSGSTTTLLPSLLYFLLSPTIQEILSLFQVLLASNLFHGFHLFTLVCYYVMSLFTTYLLVLFTLSTLHLHSLQLPCEFKSVIPISAGMEWHLLSSVSSL